MISCPECGEKFSLSEKSCPICGCPVEKMDIYCAGCGHPIGDFDAEVCPRCSSSEIVAVVQGERFVKDGNIDKSAQHTEKSDRWGEIGCLICKIIFLVVLVLIGVAVFHVLSEIISILNMLGDLMKALGNLMR